jgi:FtsP/CotA-like multicopper oxidase with cupredoxin domain
MFALAIAVGSIVHLKHEYPFASAAESAPSRACSSPVAAGVFADPPDVDVWRLPRVAGGDPEVILTVRRDAPALPGPFARATFCYRYHRNGIDELLSPILRVHAGERFAVRVVNDIDGSSAGEDVPFDRIPPCKPMTMPDMPVRPYVGYLNHVAYDRAMRMKPVDTNIHFHGFEGPADQENVFLSTLSTPMHACEYHITIPRTQPPGTYFYHAHAHGMTEDEVAGGLSGAWIVEPQTPQLPRSDDHVIMLRDGESEFDFAKALSQLGLLGRAAVKHEANLDRGPAIAYDPFNPPALPTRIPLKASGISLKADGCQGIFPAPMATINGVPAPVALNVSVGRTQLLRLINSTSNSTKLIRLRDSHGREVRFDVVARDGIPISGDSEAPLSQHIITTSVILPPAGRADILLTAMSAQDLTLYSDHICLGTFNERSVAHDLIVIHAIRTGLPTSTIASRPVYTDERVAQLLADVRAHPSLVRRRALTFTAHIIPAMGKTPQHVALLLTDTSNLNFHEHQYWPVYREGETAPENADIVVKHGTIEEWYLFNEMLDAHAFHIHQMAFAEENDPSGVPVMLDTVFVPPATALPNPKDPAYPIDKLALVKVVLDFRHVRRGTFVFHCHILAHEDNGMMGTIRVE